MKSGDKSKEKIKKEVGKRRRTRLVGKVTRRKTETIITVMKTDVEGRERGRKKMGHTCINKRVNCEKLFRKHLRA